VSASHSTGEKRPFFVHAMRVLCVPVILVWLAATIALNVFVPQLEKVTEANSVP
jgi:putative drug exporter of the RND superfamily